MKKIILFLLFAIINLNAFSTTWQIVESGLTFSPATLTIQQGDDVNFVLSSFHDAVEVSQTVWNANGITPIIGFSVPFGGGNVSPAQLTPGVHYYVCENHASLGMKGQIIVQSVTGLNDPNVENSISVYPNPVVDHLNIQIDFPQSGSFEVTLFDTQGKIVKLIVPRTIVTGTFSQSIDLSNKMTPGIYFVKIIVGDLNTYRKIVII
jgi:plastocyanin